MTWILRSGCTCGANTLLASLLREDWSWEACRCWSTADLSSLKGSPSVDSKRWTPYQKKFGPMHLTLGRSSSL